MTVTCLVCGLRNDGAATTCKRCSEPLLGAGASPARSLFGPSDAGVWKDGDVLVFRKGSELPARCVLCGGPFHVRIDHTYYWHPPGYYFLVLLNLLIYAIAAMVVRKRADVQLTLCREHAERRRRGMYVGAATALALVPALVIGFRYEQTLFVTLGLLLTGTIIAIQLRRLPTAAFIDESLVRLKGVDRSFLLPLPPYGSFR